MKRVAFILCFLLISLRSITAFTQDIGMPEGKGLSGRLEMGVVMFNTTSQLFAKDHYSEKIDYLEEKDEYTGFLFPTVMFEVGYIFQDDTEVYLEVPFYDETRKGVTLGIEQTFHDRSNLNLSVFIVKEHMWEDPYLIDVDREPTEVENRGFTIDYEQIRGTGLNLYYKNKDVDIEDDVIGAYNPFLERDGKIEIAGIGYKILLDKKSSIAPGCWYTRGDMKGNSNSFKSLTAGLVYTRETRDYFMDILISAGKNSYDKRHPLFGTSRDEKVYYVGMSFTKPELLGEDNLYARFGVSWELSEANINFFDASTFQSCISVGYNF